MRVFLVAAFVLFVVDAQRGTGAAQSAAPQVVGDPVNGKRVFADQDTVTCSRCHGLEAEGGWGPDLAGKGITLARAILATRNPIWRMPAFDKSQVTDQEILDMVTYWNRLPLTREIGKWRTEVPADAPRGQQLAVNIVGCGQCHDAVMLFARRSAGEVNGDFEWFKRQVYDHAVAQTEQWKLLDMDAAPSPPPERRRLRMGDFSPRRLPESTLREIWTWMNDLGLLVPVTAQFTGGPAAAAGATYTLDVVNSAVRQKGLAAEDVTISLMVPAGTTVVSATGTGYQGVTRDEKAKSDVAVWRVPGLAPRDRQQFTITLAGTPAGDTGPRGTVGWAKPATKSGALVSFGLPRPGGHGRGAGPGAGLGGPGE